MSNAWIHELIAEQDGTECPCCGTITLDNACPDCLDAFEREDAPEELDMVLGHNDTD